MSRAKEGSEEYRPFRSRHIGPAGSDLDLMLGALNLAHLDELIERTIPRSIRTSLDEQKLPDAISEREVLDRKSTRLNSSH